MPSIPKCRSRVSPGRHAAADPHRPGVSAAAWRWWRWTLPLLLGPLALAGDPYGGTPPAIPGTIECEAYDLGGPGIGSSDSTAGNTGGALRSDDVDIEPTSGGYNVGWTTAGEWLHYTVAVGETTSYRVTLRHASAAASAQRVRLLVDGVALATTSAPITGGWQVWHDQVLAIGTLTAGTRTLRIELLDPGINLDRLVVERVSDIAGPAVTSERIAVDQLGYRPTDLKVAVLSDPILGYNAAIEFTPGATYQVRRWADHAVVHSGAPVGWNGGATDGNAGDRGWWYDFSTLTTPGSYYVWDVDQAVGSDRFEIADDVYAPLLRTAVRMLFYNRANAAKPTANAGAWADGASHVGANQDGAARLVTDQGNPATERDLRGAWLDAGDYNKYPTFLSSTLHSLFLAYRRAPALWRNLVLDLPESTNEIPDLLDEATRGIDWLAKLQNGDGGVLLKVGCLDWSETAPPSSDTRPRYYLPAATSSTIIAAGLFAHAALAVEGIEPLAIKRGEWTQRARDAWAWFQARSGALDTNADNGTIKAGDADRSEAEQRSDAVVAAVWLFALTGEAAFRDFVRDHYTQALCWDDWWWGAWDSHSGEALMAYAALPGADAAAASAIRQRRQDRIIDLYAGPAQQGLYRGTIPEYSWGSNMTASNIGETVMQLVDAGIAPASHGDYRERALGILHYLHGVNPQGLAYLSNLEALGAERSVHSLYHSWFRPGTTWSDTRTGLGPAPGYLVGGPNRLYTGTMVVAGTSVLVRDQPRMKCYSDTNAGDSVWALTEPAIYYQCAYVQLLSRFVPVPTPRPASLTLGALGAVFDGSAHAAAVVTEPSGLAHTITYAGSLTPPSAVGSYAVLATITAAGWAGSASGTLVISGSDTPATIMLSELAVVYDGLSHPATVTTTPTGLATAITYEGSLTAPSLAGSYAVVATITEPGWSGSAVGTLVVARAPAVIGFSGLDQVVTGTPRSVTASTIPDGLAVAVTYGSSGGGSSAEAPIHAGTYTVSATVIDANHTGSATAALVVSPGGAGIAIDDGALPYTGAPRIPAVTTTPADLPVQRTYDGGATPPTAAGTYLVVATVVSPDWTGSTTRSLVVAPAAASLVLGGLAQTYTGTARTVTASTTPGGLGYVITYDGGSSAPTAVGSYTVVATITDPNHVGSVTGTLVVGRAGATVMIGGGPWTFTGAPQSVTVSTIPEGLPVQVTYDGGSAPPIHAGAHPVIATITDPSHVGTADAVMTIQPATASVLVAGAVGGVITVTADGLAHPVSLTTEPPGLPVEIRYDGSPTPPSARGTYLVLVTVSDPDWLGVATATLVISETNGGDPAAAGENGGGGCSLGGGLATLLLGGLWLISRQRPR